MKIRGQVWLVLAVAGALSGCASIGPPTAPSLELPKPPTDLKAARKGNKVTLTWTVPARTMDRKSVRYLGKTLVCRGVKEAVKAAPADHAGGFGERSSLDQSSVEQPSGEQPSSDPSSNECATRVGEVPKPADFGDKKSLSKKTTATFTDTLPAAMGQSNPTGFIAFAVEVNNAAGRSAGLSNRARVPLVPTVAPFAAFAAETSAQGVLISWQCPADRSGINGVKYWFRVYRHSAESATETRIAQLDANNCVGGSSADAQETSFLDQTLEWEHTYFYRGTVVSVIGTAGKAAVEVEGDDTPVVKVFAHDIFPPAVPAGLQAVFSGPGQQAFIDLIWTPVSDADLAGYNVYRREESQNRAGESSPPMRVNTELVNTPAYRDTQVEPGKTYFYSVSAVDERGNESGKSEEASERVP